MNADLQDLLLFFFIAYTLDNNHKAHGDTKKEFI